MNNYISLSSLSLDLRRVAMMYYRGSEEAGKRFLNEAMLRKEEIDTKKVKPYVARYLLKLEALFQEKEPKKVAEDALLYSVIFQNASLSLKQAV